MVSNTIMRIQGQCWSFKNDHTLGNIFFRINYVINKLWSGANQPLRREGDQQLISLVGSGLSHLPHGNGESDLVGWAASQSSTVTPWSALPVTSGSGSACRCNALLKKEVSVSIKPISRQAWRALKLDRALQTGPPVEQDMFSCGPDTRNTTLGARFLRHIYGLWLWLHWLSQHSLRGSTKISTKLCVTSSKTAAMPVASVPFLSGAAFHNCFETPPCEQPDSSGWLELTLFMDGAAVCTINDIRASVRIIVGFFFLLSNKLNMIDPSNTAIENLPQNLLYKEPKCGCWVFKWNIWYWRARTVLTKSRLNGMFKKNEVYEVDENMTLNGEH